MDTIEIAANGFVFDAFAAGDLDDVDSEPVLLLHGFPQTAWCWRHQLLALGEQGYRAVAFDQRGYSPRARPEATEAYSTLELVGDVLAVADALGFERFHLVGHDWGGAIAWQVAGRHADRVQTLTVLSTPHPRAFGEALRGEAGGDQAGRSAYVALFREEGSEDGMLLHDAQALRFVFAASGLPPMEAEPYVRALGTKEALRAALSWYRAADLTITLGLGPITAPTLYVWSTDDPALGPDAAHGTAACVDGPYRFEVLEGVSHWIAEQEPERTNALLLDHLGQPTTA